jgi:hypothetical protein
LKTETTRSGLKESEKVKKILEGLDRLPTLNKPTWTIYIAPILTPYLKFAPRLEILEIWQLAYLLCADLYKTKL